MKYSHNVRRIAQASHACARAVPWAALAALCGCTGQQPARIPLADAVAVSRLEEVCPADRIDALCVALRATRAADPSVARAGLDAARAAAANTVATRVGSGQSAAWDPALRLYVRERTMGLLAWYAVTGTDHVATEPTDYRERVARFLADHFPQYPPTAFPIAAVWLPPQPPAAGPCAGETDLVLILPGVVRILGRDEFATQMTALRTALPCAAVERVETPSFEDPVRNVDRVREAVARHPAAAHLHLFGYSQGGLNALAALVADPAIAARTRTVVFLDVPAHGSEVGELLYRALRPAGYFDWLWPDTPPPAPVAALATSLTGLALPPGELAEWLRAEGDSDPTLEAFLVHHLEGVRSLGTGYAEEFWRKEGSRVPRTPFYASFRAIITDPKRNLPDSNAVFYEAINRLEPRDPYNDMQVRLVSQRLGGPLADYEAPAPVAEGNHWQWAFVRSDLPDAVLPSKMVANIPHAELFLAYYGTFAEIGLLGDGPANAPPAPLRAAGEEHHDAATDHQCS